MHKLVKRIKIKKLYSDNDIFEPIVFEDGINIILGEKSDSKTIKGRKTNGVGKSMSIEFLNFCLLKKYKDSRISLIPDDILSKDTEIKLDLEIGDDCLTVIRTKECEDKPTIIVNGNIVEFDNLQDAQRYLYDLLYESSEYVLFPSFREIVSIMIREERSEFKNILKPFDISNKSIPINFRPHLFLLHISLEIYNKTQEIVKSIEDIKKVISNTKKELSEGSLKKIGDIKAELNSLEDELKKMNDAIESLKTNETFESIEGDLIELEDLIDKLRVRQKSLRYELHRIKTLPKPESIDTNDIELVYNQFKDKLGSMVVKSIEETISFKEKVESFQQSLFNDRVYDIENELEDISIQLNKLDSIYSDKVKIIDQKGVLKNLKSSLKIYNHKSSEYSKKIGFYNEYTKCEKEKKTLLLKKAEEIVKLDENIDESRYIIDSFQSTLLSIHEYIMGNRECSFDIITKNNNRSKQTIDIEMRIFDDGSHSVDRSKVFIYDISLLFNEYTNLRHPGFLIHDNIFDVDQDTLIRSLNYMSYKENEYKDFQYILTLNRDKLEHKEQLKNLNLDLEKHKRASFTKQNKFLKIDYQEL